MADVGVIGPDEKIYLVNKVAALAAWLLRYGIGAEALLEGSGVSVPALRDARTRVSRRQLITLMRNFIRLAPNERSALDAGTTLHVSNYGFYGYALLSSATCREAGEFAIAYRQLAAPPIAMRVVAAG